MTSLMDTETESKDGIEQREKMECACYENGDITARFYRASHSNPQIPAQANIHAPGQQSRFSPCW